MADGTPAGSASKASFAVTLVFALGVVFGAALAVVLLHLPGHLRAPMGPHGGPFPGPEVIDRMERELGVDAEQKKAIDEILDRTHSSIEKSLADAHKEIRALLRPDQQEKLDRMHPPGPIFPRRGPPPPPGAGPPPPPPNP